MLNDEPIHATELFDMIESIVQTNNNSNNNEIKGDEEPILCIICQEYIDMQQEVFKPTSWKLETCNHRYHISCIINWFRQGNTNCPLCGDTGVSSNDRYSNSSYYLSDILSERFKEIRKYSKKKNAPKKIKNAITRIKKMEDDEKEYLKKMKDFFKTKQEITPNEAKSMYMKYKSKKWRLHRKIIRNKNKVAQYPIVPIIIPRIKYITKVQEIPSQNIILSNDNDDDDDDDSAVDDNYDNNSIFEEES